MQAQVVHRNLECGGLCSAFDFKDRQQAEETAAEMKAQESRQVGSWAQPGTVRFGSTAWGFMSDHLSFF